MQNGQIKSKERVSAHGEVFTAEREVNAMLDLVKQETERVDSRFLEPACGDGNFLAEILRRKLVAARRMAIPPKRKKPLAEEFERQSVIAVGSCYGVEILIDNVIACRERLFGIWEEHYKEVCQKEADKDVQRAIRFILERNIICGDALSYRKVDENGKATSEPIVFSEWSFITGDKVQRKDFQFDKLVNGEYEPEPVKRKKAGPAGRQLSFMEQMEEEPSDEGELLQTYITDYRKIGNHAEKYI